MPRPAIPVEQRQNRKAEKSAADKARRISLLERNLARLRARYKNNPHVQIIEDQTSRRIDFDEQHSGASSLYPQNMRPTTILEPISNHSAQPKLPTILSKPHNDKFVQGLERNTEQTPTAPRTGESGAASMSFTTPRKTTSTAQAPNMQPAPSQPGDSGSTDKGVRELAAKHLEECCTAPHQPNMASPATSIEQTRARRERALREMMVEEERNTRETRS